MSRLKSFDGVELEYRVTGQGHPTVLLHGFAADARDNWERPGVVEALVESGRQVVVFDARGHGRSDKPRQSSAYADGAMIRDAQCLFDHLGAARYDVAGYSMGAVIASRLVTRDSRVRSLVLGGVGVNLTSSRPGALGQAISDALLADDPRSVTDPVPRAFRRFADSTGADRAALAAMQSAHRFVDDADFASISVPTLVLVGDQDALIRAPEALVERIPVARLQMVSGHHLGAMNDPAFTRSIVDFLDEVDGRQSDQAAAR